VVARIHHPLRRDRTDPFGAIPAPASRETGMALLPFARSRSGDVCRPTTARRPERASRPRPPTHSLAPAKAAVSAMPVGARGEQIDQVEGERTGR
jgi:hypothetical protein